MVIEGTPLDTRHREDELTIPRMLLDCFDFSKVEGGKAGVEMEFQLEAIASLIIG